MSHPHDNLDETPAPGDGPWRTGRSVGRTLYINDRLVGIVDFADLAATIASVFNDGDYQPEDPPGKFTTDGRTLLEDGLDVGFFDTEEITATIAGRVNDAYHPALRRAVEG